MNTTFRSLGILLLLFCIVAPGCKKELKTKTVIKPDGSCERIVILKKTSKPEELVKIPYPLPVDAGWSIRFAKVEGDTDESYIARKSFTDVSELNADSLRQGKIRIEYKLEKKFRWFFTYYAYSETYKWFSTIKKIKLSFYLSSEEYERFKNRDTSAALKKRLDEYIFENMFEDLFPVLIDSVEQLHDPSLPAALFSAKKEELRTLFKSDPKSGFDSSFGAIIGRPLSRELKRCIKNIQEAELTKLMDHESVNYTNEVTMPGIVLKTNGETVEGSTVKWKFDDERLLFDDYAMVVESRVANTWAAYVTGGGVIVLVALLMLPRLRRKGRG